MKKSMKISSSEFNGLAGIEYFDFEEDFIEKNIRCIPMIVRYKLDKAGIKLKLDEWNRLIVEERIELACRSCNSEEETGKYRLYLSGLIKMRSHREPTDLAVDHNPVWAEINKIPDLLMDKLIDDGLCVSLNQWKGLTNLQRFALLKLCKPGHESKNFPKAMKEFRLTSTFTRFRGEKQVYEISSYHKD